MLALITGIPGFGKTAHAIDFLFFQDSEFKDLEKYVEGVSGLDNVQCPHYEFPLLRDLKSASFVPCSSVDSDDEDADKYKPWLPSHPEYSEFLAVRATAKHSIELWYLWATKGSVIVIDEAQRFYRTRPSGSKVPLHIAMLEYHRHFGIHFLFTSQAPRLMDLHVRSLVEKHIHLDKTWRGGVKYEGVTCWDVESKADKKNAARSVYTPPKHVFPFYKSSSLHLKVKHKWPLAVKALFVAIPLFIGLAWFAVHTIKKNHIDKTAPVGASVLSVASGVPVVGVLGDSQSSEGKIKKYLADFSPVVPGLPESAPAFEGLRHVVVMPRVAACVGSGSACFCYSQQGSRLRDVPVERCRVMLSEGVPFNPYLEPSAPSAAVGSVPAI